MDLKVKVNLTACIGLGFGLYLGKELGKVFCEKAVPVLKEKIKTLF